MQDFENSFPNSEIAPGTGNGVARPSVHENFMPPKEVVDVEQYENLVKGIAYTIFRKVGTHVEYEDLVSIGFEGLLDAQKRYHPDAGASFITYSTFRIRGTILDSLAKSDPLTRSVRERGRQILTVLDMLTQQLGTSPTNEQIAHVMGISPEKLRLIQYELFISGVSSLDTLRDIEGDYETVEESTQAGIFENPESISIKRELAQQIQDALEKLPERYAQIVRRYYYDGLTEDEIGEEFGITGARVGQILKKSREKLSYLIKN